VKRKVLMVAERKEDRMKEQPRALPVKASIRALVSSR
jgi:hypothetical protein